MAGDNDFIQVDPQRLMQVAQRGYRRTAEMEGYLEDARRWMSIVDTFWKGAAADAYQQRLEEVMMAVEHNKDVLCRYAKRLEGLAETYGAADAKATQIAKNIEQAVWAEV